MARVEGTRKSPQTSFTIPAEPAPIPSVASSDDEDSFDSFEVLSHDMEGESFVVTEKEPEKVMENSSALPVSLTELGDIKEMINSEINRAESNSIELPEQPGVVRNGALSTSGSTHSQVEHLIHTNDMLRQNAAHLADSMRAQRDKVQKWQQEVQQCMTNYKNKLIETRTLAATLKVENRKLAEDVEKFKKIKEVQDDELVVLKTRLMQLDANDDKNALLLQIQEMDQVKTVLAAKVIELEDHLAEESLKNCELGEAREQLLQSSKVIASLKLLVDEKRDALDKANEKIASSDKKLSEISERLVKECKTNKVLTARIERRSARCVKLNEMYESAEYNRAEMDSKIKGLQENVRQLCKRFNVKNAFDYLLEEDDGLKDVHMQLEQAEEANKELRNQLEKERNDHSKLMTEKEQSLTEARSKLCEREKTLVCISGELEIEKISTQNLYLKVENLFKDKTELEAELRKTQEELKRSEESKRNVIAAYDKSKEDYEKDIDVLSREIATNRGALERLRQAAAQVEGHRHIREQLINAQKKIIDLEEMVLNKEEVIEVTRKALEEATARNDELFAFKSQLELYKSDFEMEQNLKKNLQAERDQIAEDLQNLQRRNQQLQDELELLREHSDTVICNRPSSPADSPRGAVSFQARGFACPKCQEEFGDYSTLEAHVELCLEVE